MPTQPSIVDNSGTGESGADDTGADNRGAHNRGADDSLDDSLADRNGADAQRAADVPLELALTLHGRRIAAKRWHAGEGRPTLALHGWLDNANSFDVLAPMLPALDIVAIDFAGHGHSEHRPIGINYLGMLDVQDVIGVADQLGWPRFDLLGHSMGAEVGGKLIGMFPERVDCFVGIDGFTQGTSDVRVLEELRKSIELNLNKASHPPKVFVDRAAMAAGQGR